MMSDNFFGFKSDFPAGLGVLGRPGVDDELLTDEVEEEYDALNDETFGQAANDDWEEAHEKLSELIKNNNIDVKSYFNDSLLENDDSPEEIVSKSISQLGLEDDLDDPAIMTISRNCHSSIQLRTAFSASPPPPAILESELCGSPKTHSIWSTTPKDSGISFLKSFGHSSSSRHPDSHNYSLNSGPDSVFISPQKAWRAEELEKDLLSSSKPDKPSSNWPEVSSPGPSNQNISNKFQQTQRHPNLNHNHNLNQRVFTREEVERQMHADSRLPYNKVGNFAQHMPSPIAHPNMLPIRPGNLNISMQSPPNLPFRRRGTVMGAPERPFVPFPSNLHPRSMMNHHPPRADFLLPNHPMAGVLNPYMGMPIRPINHPLMPNWKPFVFQHHEENFRNGPVHSLEDEYAGLMTQKEKEWLIRIQLLLLKCENPYVEDYYYTTMVTRKFKKKYSENAKKGSGDAPELILPEAPKPEKASYVPTQFEGSLGKLQAVSVNFPRKVLDIKVTRTLEDEEGRVVTNQSLRKYRRLLLDIEKLYTCFLEIEDEERRILALPDTGEAPHRKNIESLTQKIFNGLCTCTEQAPEENFQNLMIVRKGRTLFLRAFPLFSQEQQFQCLIYLCQCLSSILRKDQTDIVLLKNHPIISAVIRKFSLPDLVQLAEALETGGTSDSSKENNFIAALKNKFGSTVICAMVERAENIYSGSELLETDVHTKWSKVMLVLADFLCNVSNTSLCPPFTTPCQLINHFKRFILDQEKLEILMAKLKVLEGSLNGKEILQV